MTDSTTQPAISVVIPTHNPRADYLQRVLEALRVQTLPCEQWELLVVDNASKEMIVGRLDLSWHPHARVVREDALGLTNARLRGFAETTGEVIVLVDDDNVLVPDYLEQAVRIAREYSFLGTWSGALELELEPGSPEPPQELRHLLCERKPAKDVWSNDRSNFAATPWGAGECIRREVAIAYAEKVAKEPRRRQLDLQGGQLVYGGDTDIAYTGLDSGLGMGVFTSLRITHLTPKSRCTEEYLLRNYEAHAYSEVLHHWVEYGAIPKQRTDLRGRLGVLARRVLGSPLERKMIAARVRGLSRGEQFVTSHL
jgi:glycosyltransferase involved in cell wall biosynthesis